MLACIVVWSYVNFHAITMDRFFLMITVSPIKSCFEIRSTLANFERSKSPEYFHTIGTAVSMLIHEEDKFVSIELSALTVAVN